MAVPAWIRNRSKLDAEYEAVKFRVIVTQMIMRNFGLKYELCSTKEKKLMMVKWSSLKHIINLSRGEDI